MKSKLLLIFVSLSMFMACRHRRPDSPDEVQEEILLVEDLEAPMEYPYRASATRAFDLLHTSLDVRFDWPKEEMHGTATLRMKPWFHPSSQVPLDAKGFLIHRVARKSDTTLVNLRYDYDLTRLTVHLDRPFTRQEEFELYIEYTARPAALDSLVSKEAAQEQGLYFVNPHLADPSKPQQIWTQGESHGASGWFPTIDQPNERCTQEMRITVADSFVTLSNGLLVGSQRNPDGTRTDNWKMSLPHAPYLFMLAVGKFSKTTDQWRGKEVSYYVEPEYAPYAKLIFGNTPEMIEFFSNKLGVDYPWDKYAQIVVRDFVSGAMENTTATVHYDKLQHDAREHLDETQEDFISHELFHQWFGDLVTCESWANLTLNEGFATYGEYLWQEYKYGKDDADYHLEGDRFAYLTEADYKREPLIRYHHSTPDAMFDSHSYQKGGLVLHMLRYYLGDSVFFQALKLYLTRHAYTDVEAHELRMAFEEVSGEDLNWFFDQWYFSKGHPELKIDHEWDGKAWNVRVQQLQDMDAYGCFRFPVRFEIQSGKLRDYHDLWVETADTTFSFSLSVPPDNVVFDADKVLLTNILVEDKPHEAWLYQLNNGSNYGQKSQALQYLETRIIEQAEYAAITKASTDPFWAIRDAAITMLAVQDDLFIEQSVPTVLKALADPKAAVRNAACEFFMGHVYAIVGKYAEADLEPMIAAFEKAATDSSYDVQASGLSLLYSFAPEKAVAFIEQNMQQIAPRIAPDAAKILVKADRPSAFTLAEPFLRPESSYNEKLRMLYVLGPAADHPNNKEQALTLLMQLAKQEKGDAFQYSVATFLGRHVDIPRVRAFVEELVQTELNPQIVEFYKKFLEK